jgi:TetR/AcrR family transcriptional repressor of nem operon
MKKSKVEAAETRKRIIAVAAQAFRSNGIRATGVAEIMTAAGLTHGAFYRHFESKDQLVAEACAASIDTLVSSSEVAAEEGDEPFLKHLEDFLSTEYRDDGLAGCPFVAMGSELARADLDTRRAASVGFRGLVDIIASREQTEDVESAKADAMFTLSSMIGAVTMAKIVDDPALSRRILEVTKKRLAKPPAKSLKKRVRSNAA